MKKVLGIISIIFLSLYLANHEMFIEKISNKDLYKNALLTTSGNPHSQSSKPDYKIIYDTLLTTLDPSIQKEIINYYGYPKQYGLYDAEILSIIRHEGEFGFIVKVQVTTFEHADDPPNGKETITFNVDPFGVKTISFQHKGDKLEKDINDFYKTTLSDIKQSFNLNLKSYTAYTYNQLQYQAEINNEFKSLFTIAEEIVTDILFHERMIPDKNVIDPVTYLKDNTGYILFKMSDSTKNRWQLDSNR